LRQLTGDDAKGALSSAPFCAPCCSGSAAATIVTPLLTALAAPAAFFTRT
jgi:hypothetical protein